MSTINTNHTPSMWDKYMPKKLNEQEAKLMGERIANNPANYKELLASAPKNRSFQDVIRGDTILGVYAGSMASLTGKRLYLGDDQAAYEAWRASENKDHANSFAYYEDKEIWNAKGLSNTINTPYGEMRVSLKMDGFYYDVENLSELSYLDSYNDGLISKDDYLADKLVLRGYDANGDEVELNFLDVIGAFDLTELYNDKKAMLHSKQHTSGTTTGNIALSLQGNSSYRAEVSYQKHDTKNTIAFFESYADKNGWIDFKNDDVARRIFDSQSLQLAYRKVGADGTSRLEKISIGTNYDLNLETFRKSPFMNHNFNGTLWQYFMASGLEMGTDFDRKTMFSAIFNKETIGGGFNTLAFSDVRFAQAFTDFTGLAYTEANMQKVKEGLENGGEEFLNSLTDIEAVTAMKLDKDSGKITLRFSSGRETTIAMEDLYSESGEFIVDENGERAMQMNGAAEMSEEDLNNLDFAQVGIKDETGTIVSLKDLGITAIQKATYPDGRFLSFILTNADGNKINAQDLYNIFFVTSGGLESSHKEDSNTESNAESKSALDNTNKDSNSLTSKIRKMSNPLVYPNKPSVDVRI